MTVNLKPEPNSVWVITDLNVAMSFKPGSVPKTSDELLNFSECLNEFLISHDAQYANYILFGDDAKPIASLECEF